MNVVKFNHHWSSLSIIKIVNSYAYQQMQTFWISLYKEHSDQGSKHEKDSTNYHQPSPDKKVCTKWLMNHWHNTKNKVNLLVREDGVISKCCSLGDETDSNKLQRQLKVLVCYDGLYTINHLLCNCKIYNLQRCSYFLKKHTITIPDAINPVTIFSLSPFELNEK